MSPAAAYARLAGSGVAGLLFAASALAECGGSVQCIAVGATPADAAVAHHPAPDLGTPTFTLTFGTQTTGTTSASQTINVAAVGGGSGMAVLGPITISGANASEFSITGGTCSTTNGPVHGGAQCTVTVAFSPLSAGAKSALVNVPLDPPCAGCIAGRSVGLAATGFGPTVTAPRGDPSRDANVIAAVRAQAQTALRFSRAQIVNFQQRMESLRAGAGSLEPSSASGATRSPGLEASTGLWVGGSLNFGKRGERSEMSSLRFSTTGISLGADRRFGESLALGLGIGFARDETDIGSDGSESRAAGQSIAVYASYRPTARLFIDGLLGYGRLEHDTDRFVASANDFARSERQGRQTFGSIAAGYEYRDNGLLLSPYVRLAFTNERLDQATETGAGSSALTYFEQRLSSSQASLGVRAQSLHETSFGWAQPRLRVELAHDSISDRPATIAFADQLAGPTFSISPLETKRTSLLIGIGSDFLFRRGLKLGLDYQHERLAGPDSNQTIRLWLSQDLDGRTPSPGPSYSSTFANPVNVEATYSWDDNLNRAPDAGPKLSDHIYSLNAGKNFVIPVTGHTRLVLNGFLEGDKLYEFDGLDRFSLGAQGEFQYRRSAAFGAPTFGVFVRASLDDYHSELRTGNRRSLGLTVRQAITDRLEIFGALARNSRNADHAAFETQDTSGRVNLDYALGPGTLYLGGEYRRGDAVSSVGPGFEAVVASKASVRDDAYGRTLFAHRYEARTLVGTLGYNWPLGSRDSLDFSARRAQTEPTQRLDGAGAGAYAGGGTPRYSVNQFSLAYLMRF